ncbi:hypothetical protein PCASD_19171 [Puccinia coronata f. sp. avenae]|uniref:Uncharacterized protein n=1 Tax=Puccinia coronata f. sp. avenae TaxID=200324 RepID=A0A2N5TYB4_9BASI|nr:hypothetical protein PCASD_19171 [Puccinia coronata f. sp. avenae]
MAALGIDLFKRDPPDGMGVEVPPKTMSCATTFKLAYPKKSDKDQPPMRRSKGPGWPSGNHHPRKVGVSHVRHSLHRRMYGVQCSNPGKPNP